MGGYYTINVDSLEEVIEAWPKGAKKVLVTGPQRTGTTIGAKILSDILGFEFVSEEVIDVDDLEKFFSLHMSLDNYVLQAPGLSFICHRLPVDVVIFMNRAYSDIRASGERINWNKEWSIYEVTKYLRAKRSDPITTKYNVWKSYQKPHLDMAGIPHFDLWYESLKSHPLWIDKELRKDFTPRQILK